MVETMVPPARSLQQRLDALEKANDVRSYRAVLKRDLRDGRVAARDVLTGDDPRLESMRVFELLLAIPKVGRVKVNKWLARARVSPSKTLGALTARQRAELLGIAGPWLRARPRGML